MRWLASDAICCLLILFFCKYARAEQDGLNWLWTPHIVIPGETYLLQYTDPLGLTVWITVWNTVTTQALLANLSSLAADGECQWTVPTNAPLSVYAFLLGDNNTEVYSPDFSIISKESASGMDTGALSTSSGTSGTSTTTLASTITERPTSTEVVVVMTSKVTSSASRLNSQQLASLQTTTSVSFQVVTPTASASSDRPAQTTRTSTASSLEPPRANEGLSTGAKAAIGVCVPVGVFAIIGAAFLCGRLARKTPATEDDALGQYQSFQAPYEIDEGKPPLPPRPPSELPHGVDPVELSSA